MKPGEPIVWFDMEPHLYWMVKNVSGVRFGDSNDDAYTWADSPSDPSDTSEDAIHASYPAIFDSGTSMIMLPRSIYTNFIDKLF